MTIFILILWVRVAKRMRAYNIIGQMVIERLLRKLIVRLDEHIKWISVNHRFHSKLYVIFRKIAIILHAHFARDISSPFHQKHIFELAFFFWIVTCWRYYLDTSTKLLVKVSAAASELACNFDVITVFET